MNGPWEYMQAAQSAFGQGLESAEKLFADQADAAALEKLRPLLEGIYGPVEPFDVPEPAPMDLNQFVDLSQGAMLPGGTPAMPGQPPDMNAVQSGFAPQNAPWLQFKSGPPAPAPASARPAVPQQEGPTRRPLQAPPQAAQPKRRASADFDLSQLSARELRVLAPYLPALAARRNAEISSQGHIAQEGMKSKVKERVAVLGALQRTLSDGQRYVKDLADIAAKVQMNLDNLKAARSKEEVQLAKQELDKLLERMRDKQVEVNNIHARLSQDETNMLDAEPGSPSMQRMEELRVRLRDATADAAAANKRYEQLTGVEREKLGARATPEEVEGKPAPGPRAKVTKTGAKVRRKYNPATGQVE